VIAKIQKDYAGQGQKVMNAMWGAGQMMFNKILVITASGAPSQKSVDSKLSDYESVARDVFKNMNPATDIYFSQGPMDVLDHSCSKMGFGGKMCIDGTFKYPEEADDQFSFVDACYKNETSKELMNVFPEINGINATLVEKGIPCLVVSIKKNKKGHVQGLHKLICDQASVEGIKIILYVEHTVDPKDLPIALWRFCNNLDPKRDHFLEKRQSTINPAEYVACIGFDGTIKTKEFDNFYRDWPNIIIADRATIASVDEKWKRLGLGDFISSPSLKFEEQMYGNEAIASDYAEDANK